MPTSKKGSHGLSHVYMSTPEGLMKADGKIFRDQNDKKGGKKKPVLQWGALWGCQKKMADLQPHMKQKETKAIIKMDRVKYKRMKKVEEEHSKNQQEEIVQLVAKNKEGKVKAMARKRLIPMRKAMKKVRKAMKKA